MPAKAKSTAPGNPEQQLDGFLAKFDPPVRSR
jgi:hypothetical protein